jgi:protein tyrosine phosphatase (PTP) superfamily phosphohydrolase (DUF442 family)
MSIVRECHRSLASAALLAAASILPLACGADGSATAAPVASSSGARQAPPAAQPPAVGPAAAAVPASSAAAPASAGHGDSHDQALHRVKRWSDRVIQGAQPMGDPAFKEIAALGAKTVISVDGAIPDVETAAKYGLKYVHVPIGYDGINADEQARIVKAVEESDGAVFVHCHHGQHRGPAAAAIARIAADGVSHDEAYKGLEESGCSKSYGGLYEVVKGFVPPTPEQLAALPPLPSAVRPQGIQEAMVHIDERWEYFKALKTANWAPPADAPDKSPPHEVTILRELFVELDRLDDSKGKGDDFLAHSVASQAQLTTLEAALEAQDGVASVAAFDAVTASCKACHTGYRD